MKEKLLRVLGTQFGDVLKGSSLNFLAKVLATGIGFIGSILIAHFYNAEVIGKIATISSLLDILTLVVLLGNQTYILRKIPSTLDNSGPTAALSILNKLFLLVAVTGVLITSLTNYVLPFATALNESLTPYHFLLYGLVFANAAKQLSIPTLRATGDYKVFSTFELLPPFFMVVAVLISAAVSVDEKYFYFIYYAPHFLLAALVFVIARNRVKAYKPATQVNPTSAIPPTPSIGQVLLISTPMLGVSLSNVLIARTDILMLSSMTNELTVGVYSIYVKITALMSLGVLATNSMFSPKASKLYDRGDIEELGRLTRQTATLAFAVALICMVGILVIHQVLLGLYGEEFLFHLPTLYILLFAMLSHAFFGPVGILLNMTGEQKIFFRIIFAAAALNIVLNYFLIPIYGPKGAAIATLSTTIFWNLLAAVRVKRVHGFMPLPMFLIPARNAKIKK